MFSESLRLKLQFIGWPYLRLWLLLHGGLATLGALLAWQWPSLNFSDSLFYYFGVITLAALIIFWKLKYAIAFIKQSAKEKGNEGFLFFTLTLFAFASAIATVPQYIVVQFGRMQLLPTLASLPRYPPARYYQARTVLLDTLHRATSPSTYMSGGKASHRYFQLAIVCPVAEHLPSSVTDAAPVWVGFYYRADTTALPFINDYWRGYQHFIAHQQALFRSELQRPCCYFERQYSAQVAQAFQEALPTAAGSSVVLQPVYTPFENRASSILSFWLWAEGTSLLLLALLIHLLDPFESSPS